MARRPFGFVRELLRSDVRRLHLVVHSVSVDSDVLVADGRVASVRHTAGRRSTLGPPPAFKMGQVPELIETSSTLVMGLRAALANVAFFPVPEADCAELLDQRPDLARIESPYDGSPLVALPAVRPEVAIIHAHSADRSGNAMLVGPVGLDHEFALAAETTIVTAETIVDRIERKSDGTLIGCKHVAAVVELPYGAYPTACLPSYRWDLGFTLTYYDAVREGRFEALLENISGPSYDGFIRDHMGTGAAHPSG